MAIDDVIDRINRIPGSYREFTVPAPLPRSFGIGGELLSELLSRGLPAEGPGPRRRFDARDLMNVGIELGLACDASRRMRLWARALAAVAGQDLVGYQLKMRVDCPDPGHQGNCPLELNPCVPQALPEGGLRREPAGFAMAPVIAAGREPLGALAALIGDVQALRFHLLPVALASDLAFAADTGLADGPLAARVLAARARDRGLAVRAAAGMVLTPPSALPHEWLEVSERGSWVAADPFMLTAFARWGLLDPAVWPPTRPLPAVAWRLFRRWNEGAARHIAGQGLVTHGGSWARMQLLVLRHQPVPVSTADTCQHSDAIASNS